MPDPDLTSMLTRLHLTTDSGKLADTRIITPGCEPWCDGRGARRQPAEALPHDPTHVPTMVETLRTLRYDYCSCPAGVRAQERHDSAIRLAAEREMQLAASRLWEAAGVPTRFRAFTIESYLRQPWANPSLVACLRRWQPAAAGGASLILHGPQGTAKTGLAASLLQEALEDGRDGLFLVCRDWLSEIRSTYRPGRNADDAAADEWLMIRAAATAGLLVLDDVNALTEWGQDILFSLLNQRDAWMRPTILTTNLTLPSLEACLGKRTFDRLRGSALDPRTGETFVLELTGESPAWPVGGALVIHRLEFPEQAAEPMLPPHNLEAERAVLGSVLLDREVIGRVSGVVQARDFYRERHGAIYAAMLSLFERQEPVDYLTLSAELGNEAMTTDLIDLLGAVPTPIHAERYAVMVAEAGVKRRLISAGGKIATLGYQQQHDAATALEKSEQLLLEVASERPATDSRSFGAYLAEYLDDLLAIQNGQSTEAALPTGFADLDRLLNGGLRRAELTVLAARPAMGKSSLSMNIGVTAAMRFGASVAVFSLEMTGKQLVMRAVAAEARIEAARLQAGQFAGAEEARLGAAISRLAEMQIELAEPLLLTPSDLRARVRRMSARQPLDLVIVDHIGLMSTGRRGGNRVEEVTEITRQLKALAMDEGVAVLALCQLSRAVEQRSPKIPILSDLRESGSIEQDADVVVFIYRDDYYDHESPKRGLADLIVAKNRNGPNGQVSVLWDHRHTRFIDMDANGQEEQAKWWQ